MEGLKPCPFCGGRVTITYNSLSNVFNVYHVTGECHFTEPFQIDGDHVHSLAEARDYWNKRTSK